ncbi:enkurin-like [Parasteatoda tepidariorum]|uniref:enkurin-like n=1 Tax=Parasteatoda tepidariorum TaxID=114398 RepID=UPI0039BC5758
MGYSNLSLNSPNDYLRKRSSESRKDANKSVNCLCRMRNCKERSAPKAKESLEALPEVCQRDFRTENFLDVLKRPPTTPARRSVDNRKGDSFDLETSGLVPKYTFKEDYGKTPTYIKKIEENLDVSRKEFLMSLNCVEPEPQILSMEEKEKILRELVKNLKGLMKLYLTLPVSIDTPRLIKRKLDIENHIDDIQQQIDLIQRHKDILVGKDSVRNMYH